MEPSTVRSVRAGFGGCVGAVLTLTLYLALPVDEWRGAFAAMLVVPILGAWSGVHLAARNLGGVLGAVAGWIIGIYYAEYHAPYPSSEYAGALAMAMAVGYAIGSAAATVWRRYR